MEVFEESPLYPAFELLSKKRIASALATFEREPGSPEAWMLRGVCFYRMGRFGEAIPNDVISSFLAAYERIKNPEKKTDFLLSAGFHLPACKRDARI